MAQQTSADKIQAAALRAWIEGRLNKEFTAKQRDRGISDADIERVLKSNAALIGKYRHHDQPRYGFWHPETGVFVAWQPAVEGDRDELKTCFIAVNGDSYMRERQDFTPVRGF